MIIVRAHALIEYIPTIKTVFTQLSTLPLQLLLLSIYRERGS